jgi:hypothetical protein
MVFYRNFYEIDRILNHNDSPSDGKVQRAVRGRRTNEMELKLNKTMTALALEQRSKAWKE